MERNGRNWYWTRTSASRIGKYTASFEQSIMKKTLGDAGSNLFVLDVGGGDGQHARYVKKLGHSPVLLDPDSVPLEILLEKGTDIPAIRANGLALPIRESVFDVVMTIEVSVCLSGKDDANVKYFKDANRILKKNGLFLATTFNKNSYISYLKRINKNRPGWEEQYYLEGVNDYRRKLDEAGFEIEGCWGYRWLPFRRESNNRLIPALAFLEKTLLLSRLTHVSPWLFFAARKR